MKAKKINQVESPDQSDKFKKPAEKLRLLALKDLAQTLAEELNTVSELSPLDINRGLNFYKEVREFEIELIQTALRRAGGKQVGAARLLNLNTTTLNSKIKSYNIQIEPPFGVIGAGRVAHASNIGKGSTTCPEPETVAAEDVPVLG